MTKTQKSGYLASIIRSYQLLNSISVLCVDARTPNVSFTQQAQIKVVVACVCVIHIL